MASCDIRILIQLARIQIKDTVRPYSMAALDILIVEPAELTGKVTYEH
ncbi:hypothetical protein [Ferrimicrobium sp.]|nr:hypothetical protein [Ferrimicrobium sp.]